MQHLPLTNEQREKILTMKTKLRIWNDHKTGKQTEKSDNEFGNGQNNNEDIHYKKQKAYDKMFIVYIKS